jgi:hypothetical protein
MFESCRAHWFQFADLGRVGKRGTQPPFDTLVGDAARRAQLLLVLHPETTTGLLGPVLLLASRPSDAEALYSHHGGAPIRRTVIGNNGSVAVASGPAGGDFSAGLRSAPLPAPGRYGPWWSKGSRDSVALTIRFPALFNSFADGPTL